MPHPRGTTKLTNEDEPASLSQNRGFPSVFAPILEIVAAEVAVSIDSFTR